MLLKYKKKTKREMNKENQKKRRRKGIDKIKLNIIGIKEMLPYKLQYLKNLKKSSLNLMLINFNKFFILHLKYLSRRMKNLGKMMIGTMIVKKKKMKKKVKMRNKMEIMVMMRRNQNKMIVNLEVW